MWWVVMEYRISRWSGNSIRWSLRYAWNHRTKKVAARTDAEFYRILGL